MKIFSDKKKLLCIIFIAAAICIAALTAGAVLGESSNTTSFRNQLSKGNIAIAHFNNYDGLLLCTGNGERSEYFAEEGMAYEYTSADEYTFRGKDGIYLTGTFDNSAVAFYVREAEAEARYLSISAKAVQEAEFFAGIKTDTPASSTLSIAVSDGTDIMWRELTTLNGDSFTTTEIWYEDCPYDEVLDAYLIVIRSDNGMTCFDTLSLSGLVLAELENCNESLFYSNGELRHGSPDGESTPADEKLHFNTILLREALASELSYSSDKDCVSFLDFAFRLYDFIMSVLSFFSMFEG